jgi:type VI secretion system secreted protein VgrG
MSVKLKGSTEVVIECPGGIKLVCGGSSISLTPASIDIAGTLVNINCGGGGGSAGAAETAAAASLKEVADAKVLEDLKPDKAQDYDKLLADPFAAAEGGDAAPTTRPRSGAMSAAAGAASGAAGAAAGAAGAAGGAAGAAADAAAEAAEGALAVAAFAAATAAGAAAAAALNLLNPPEAGPDPASGGSSSE